MEPAQIVHIQALTMAHVQPYLSDFSVHVFNLALGSEASRDVLWTPGDPTNPSKVGATLGVPRPFQENHPNCS